MVTDKRIVDISSDDVTVLGHQGEHLTRVVRFPQVKEWRDALGPGEAFLLVRRPGEETDYPAPLDAEDDGTVLWAVRREDVERSGEGQVQLTYRLGDRVARSQTFRTRVEESLDRPGPAPAPQQSWVDQVMASETAARASADRAEQAAAGVEDISQQVQQVENAKNAALRARDEAQKAAEGVKDVGQQVQQVQEGVAAAQAAADRAQAATVHGPKIEAGKWQVWDSTGGQYADTGVRAAGKTPALTIGTVETVPAEGRADATITGTDEAPVLNLSIPQGRDGAGGGPDHDEVITIQEDVAEYRMAEEHAFEITRLQISLLAGSAPGVSVQLRQDHSRLTADVSDRTWKSLWAAELFTNILPGKTPSDYRRALSISMSESNTTALRGRFTARAYSGIPELSNGVAVTAPAGELLKANTKFRVRWWK